MAVRDLFVINWLAFLSYKGNKEREGEEGGRELPEHDWPVDRCAICLDTALYRVLPADNCEMTTCFE